MTTLYIKSDGPAVRSSVELESVDKFDHPDHGWMWRECEVRWIHELRRLCGLSARRASRPYATRRTEAAPTTTGRTGLYALAVPTSSPHLTRALTQYKPHPSCNITSEIPLL